MLCKCMCLTLLATVISAATAASAPWKLEIDAASFTRYTLMDPEGNGLQPPEARLIPQIKTTHRLAGEGWVEYDFEVPATGWYELSCRQGESVQDHDFFLDGQVHVYGQFDGKISNLWLTAGKHTLRAQRYTWTGLASVSGFGLTRSDESLAQALRVQVGNDRLVLRQGESLDLDLYAGGRTAPATLTVWVKRVDGDSVVTTLHVPLAATPAWVLGRLSTDRITVTTTLPAKTDIQPSRR